MGDSSAGYSVQIEKRTWLPAFVIPLLVVATILLGIRLVSRIRRTASTLGFDDIFIVLSWVLSTVNIALVLLACYRYGLDRHIWDVPSNQWPKTAFISWLVGLLYILSTSLTKISILMFYRRLAKGAYSKRFKIAIWVAIGIVTAYTIIACVLLLSVCTPLNSLWLQLDPTYTKSWHCIPASQQRAGALFGGVMSVVTDLYSVLLPAILLLKIRTTRRQQIGLVVIFGLGFLVVVAGVVRTVYLIRIQSNAFDKTWLGFNVFIAGIVEGKLGILCACAPSLRTCFRRFFESHSTRGSSAATALGKTEISHNQSSLADGQGGRVDWNSMP